MRLLLVDDDRALRESLAQGLTQVGYSVQVAAGGSDARAALEAQEPIDLLLLDVEMPDVDGWEVLASLRRRGDETPVIFLTGRSGLDDRVRGLREGADDYVVKPFEFAELLARIEAVLRRHVPPEMYVAGSLRFDLTARRVTGTDHEVELSDREFDLVATLLRAEGEALSRGEIVEQAWGMHFDPGTNVVDVVVMRVRRKLDRTGHHSILTVPGVGYAMRGVRARA